MQPSALSKFGRSISHALDPVELARDVGLDLDPWQARCLRSDSNRILLCCSRQAGKSTTAALRAAHALLFDPPGSLVVIVSPSQRQSQEIFRTLAGLLHRLDTGEVGDETTLKLETRSGSRCIALPASPTTIRGLSAATLVIVDEAAFVLEDLFSTLSPMLAVRRGRLMALSTPNGTAGWFYDQWTRGIGWDRYRVTCWDVPRFEKPWLEAERDLIGPLRFSREYEAEFIEDDSALFTAAMIEAALDATIKPMFPDFRR